MPTRRVRRYRSRKSKKPILIAGLLVAIVVIIIVAFIAMGTGGGSNKNKVLLRTSIGDIVIQLRGDMPITTENFKNLVQQGKYDGTIFHRVIADFMIQGGQINSSWPNIQDEFSSNNHNVIGTIAMAKTKEPNSATSQFFINVANNGVHSATFDTTYSVFGEVIEGMNVVDAISKVPVVEEPITHEVSKPVQNVILIKAELID